MNLWVGRFLGRFLVFDNALWREAQCHRMRIGSVGLVIRHAPIRGRVGVSDSKYAELLLGSLLPAVELSTRDWW